MEIPYLRLFECRRFELLEMLHTIDYGIFSKVYGPLFRHDRFLLVLDTFLLEYKLV